MLNPGSQRSRVIVLGSVNTDLVIKSARLPQPGETVLGGEFYRAAGGKGANQAVAAARSSTAPVTFIAAVGDDSFGREAEGLLRRENLNCRHLKVVPGEPSGVALILVDEGGENVISVASGANLHLWPADVDAVAEEDFEAARVFLTCLESPLETVVAGLRRARRAGLITILNPAPARADIMSEEILSLVDVITPNQSEAEWLTGIAAATIDEASRAAGQLRELGCRRVVLTRGEGGAVVVDGDETVAIASHNVEAVDTTAAGDAFNGALATALSEGRDLPDACRWATAAAAIAVTRRGAQPSLATRQEIEARFRL